MRTRILGIVVVMACSVGGYAASATNLKPIEPLALQGAVEAMGKEFMLPGAMVLLQDRRGPFSRRNIDRCNKGRIERRGYSHGCRAHRDPIVTPVRGVAGRVHGGGRRCVVMDGLPHAQRAWVFTGIAERAFEF